MIFESGISAAAIGAVLLNAVFNPLTPHEEPEQTIDLTQDLPVGSSVQPG